MKATNKAASIMDEVRADLAESATLYRGVQERAQEVRDEFARDVRDAVDLCGLRVVEVAELTGYSVNRVYQLLELGRRPQ